MSNEAIAAEAAGGEVLAEQPEASRPLSVARSDDDIINDAFDQAAKDEAEGETAEKPGAKEARPDKADKTAKAAEKDAEAAPEKAKAERAPDGKFKAAEKPDDEADAKPDAGRPRQSVYPEAPSRFDDAAKSEWEGVGENARGAIHRMQRELEAGIQKYRSAAEEYEGVREYAEMARASGTDLKSALDRYVAMENELRRDPIAGLQAVVANLGLKGANGQPATLRDVAAFVLGQKPDQAASRQEATIMSLRNELAEMRRQMAGVSQHVAAQRDEARANSIASEWNAFSAANRHAAAYEAEMAEFLTKYPAGGNISVRDRLSDALAWAQARYPEKTAAHTRAADAAHTREMPDKPVNPAGRKSISGAPGGSTSQARNLSTDDIIARALDAHGF